MIRTEQGSQDSSKCYSYIAMRLKDLNKQLAWIFYENQQEINQGVIVIQDYSSVHESRDGDLDFLCLLGAIHRVCSVGGFVAGFFCKPAESSSDVFA
jgi:hypothetical protein